MTKQNRDNEKSRNAARSKIAERLHCHENAVSNLDILKVRLAEECNWECPYTADRSLSEALVGKHAQFDIEHIIRSAATCIECLGQFRAAKSCPTCFCWNFRSLDEPPIRRNRRTRGKNLWPFLLVARICFIRRPILLLTGGVLFMVAECLIQGTSCPASGLNGIDMLDVELCVFSQRRLPIGIDLAPCKGHSSCTPRLIGL